MEELLTKVITIAEVGLEEKRLKITDDQGLVYSIWRTKKDGTPTKAFEAFNVFALQASGKQWDIQHDERPNPNNERAKYRTIFTIRPYTGQSAQPTQTTEKSVTGKDLLNMINELKSRVLRLEEQTGVSSYQIDTKTSQNANFTASASVEAMAKDLGGEVLKSPLQEGDEGYIDVNDIPF